MAKNFLRGLWYGYALKGQIVSWKASKWFSQHSIATVPTILEPARNLGKRSGKIPDKVRIYVRGGAGGQGCPSTGGRGGRGGHVTVTSKRGGSLATYAMAGNRRIIAGQGVNSTRESVKTRKGKDVTICVPPGTIIWSDTGQLLGDLNKEGDTMKVASGGDGGSQTNTYLGQKGERRTIVLELKVIADVALVGMPNAGKSTLLRAISKARPKVASYPFTTLNPMVGSVWYSDQEPVAVADLPGLIEEAHLNRGMGHRFLRHVERTKALALVVDINGFQLKESSPFRSAYETLLLLLNELALYHMGLLSRPFVLVLNKMDVAGALPKQHCLYEQLLAGVENVADDVIRTGINQACKRFVDNNFSRIVCTSGQTGEGIDLLKERFRAAVREGESLDNTGVLYRQ